jgi:CarboxypepD_reg-like domain
VVGKIQTPTMAQFIRTYFIILTILFFASCSTSKMNAYPQPVSKILTLERAGIMDTVTVVIVGRCVDIEENKSLAEASIKLSRNDTVTYVGLSDGLGNFKFNHIRAGRYEIEVTCLGYNTKDTTAMFRTGDIWKLEVGLSKWSKEKQSKVTF